MKTFNKLFQVFIFALIISLFTSCAQQTLKAIISQDIKKTTHYITLLVDTEKIDNTNELKVCSFKYDSFESEGLIQSENIEDFLIKVNPGDTVIWLGAPKNNIQSHIVNIWLIQYESGFDIFGQKKLRSNGQSPEKVVGTINAETYEKELKYSIKFTVFIDGKQKSRNLQIDPKITVKPKGFEQ